MLISPLVKLAYIITKAREFDAEVPPVDDDSVTNIPYPTQGPIRPSWVTSDTRAPVSHPSERRDRSRRGDR
jgi:hypothetical protein